MNRLLLIAACLGSVAHAADRPAAAVKAAPPASTTAATIGAPQGDPGACAGLLAAIENGEKELASLKAEGFSDNSAPRETTRLLAKLSEQQRQSQNLTMMVALRCPNLPAGRLRDGWRYYASALECRAAFSDKKKEEAKQICDRANWLPSKMVDDPQ